MARSNNKIRNRSWLALPVACLLVGGSLAVTGVAKADTKFYLPFPEGESYRINQGPEDHGGAALYNEHAVDFNMRNDTVVASADGTVYYAGRRDGQTGNVVLLLHGDSEATPKQCTQYAHLSEITVEEQDKVSAGQKIAVSGESGLEDVGGGLHLHWNLVDCDTMESLAIINTVERGTDYTTGETATSQNAPPSESETEVSPEDVTFNDNPGTADDTYEVPEVEGVDYLIDDEVVEPGTYPGEGDVTVTAKPGDGYKFAEDSKTEWTFTFDATSPDPKPSASVTATSTPSVTATSTPSVTATSTPSVTTTPSATATATATTTTTTTTTSTATTTATKTKPVSVGLPATGR